MSLDLYMITKSCEQCGHTESTETLNMTYNVWNMWKEIFPDAVRMVDIDGISGKDSEVILEHAFKSLIKSPKKFMYLEPPNGWGTYNDFMNYIEKLYILSIKHPDGVWQSYR